MTGSELWIEPIYRPGAINFLLEQDLIKYDPRGKLPLASGGTTDVYINLRNARSRPTAIAVLAHLYAPQLMRLGAQRFAEIPDSVSCIAGHIATMARIPYVTIRKQEKEGRVSDARVIGELIPGEQMVIIDDVINDGESKVLAYRVLQDAGITDIQLVVLVDREEGWQETFKHERVDMPVLAAMTLNDVRNHLKNTGFFETSRD